MLAATMAGASAEVRSLKLYHLHTHEKSEIVYKRNGRYDPAGLKKINHILRDWRRNEPIKMDPRLLDLVWEAYRESGASGYIQVIGGYRAPATNSMLRRRSKGVAQKSQHMLGKALDFYIPGVPLKKLRDIGLRMQGGGVGYYPSSGSPFVHMDVGNVRHWPGISRQELARVFPDGKTLHMPSDGKPLPGYEQAMAAYKARKASGTPNIELASAGGSSRKSGGLLATLFGGGADEEEDVADVAIAAPAAKPKAAVQPKGDLPGIAVVAPEKAQRADIEIASDDVATDTPETIIAALPARAVPLPSFAPRPRVDVGEATPETVPFALAEASAPPAVEGEGREVAQAVPAPGAIPFGLAEAGAAAEERQAVAYVPLPSRRPELTSQPGLDSQKRDPVLLALAQEAERSPKATQAFAMLPTPRPDNAPERAELVQAALRVDEVKAVLEKVSRDQYEVASIAAPAMPRSVFSDPIGVDAASPRAALMAKAAGSDPTAVLGGAKTTRKEARPGPQDAKPDRKATVVAAEPKAARWALQSNEEVTRVGDADAMPRLAYNLVRTSPSEVYTAGFQTGDGTLDAHHFTGTAVKFLTVARFENR